MRNVTITLLHMLDSFFMFVVFVVLCNSILFYFQLKHASNTYSIIMRSQSQTQREFDTLNIFRL